MKKSLQDIIESSKLRLQKSFFQIIKDDNSLTKYSIKEYFGPMKSVTTMMKHGWNRHPYLKKYINDEYPVFNIFDFKSVDGITIEKKSEVDVITAELNQYLELFQLNKKLFESTKNLKEFLNQFGFSNYGKYKVFSELQNDFLIILGNNISNQVDKQKFNSFFVTLLNEVYINLELVNISSPRSFFENKFMYLFSLIK
jgi:hypothetical protein